VVEDDGYLFATVETGREMRGALNEDDYDIVIIDVTSPRLTRFALAQVAREQGYGVILGCGTILFGDEFLE
jgi:DNA-binding response OmpR family regulator